MAICKYPKTTKSTTIQHYVKTTLISTEELQPWDSQMTITFRIFYNKKTAPIFQIKQPLFWKKRQISASLESMFSFFTFAGLVCLEKDWLLVSLMLLAFATCTRANGILVLIVILLHRDVQICLFFQKSGCLI